LFGFLVSLCRENTKRTRVTHGPKVTKTPRRASEKSKRTNKGGKIDAGKDRGRGKPSSIVNAQQSSQKGRRGGNARQEQFGAGQKKENAGLKEQQTFDRC